MRLNDYVERLVDEAVRFRGEAREAAEKSADMAFALRALGDRVIECALGTARAVANRTRIAMRRFARRPVQHTRTSTRTSIGHNFSLWRKALPMPKKEVKRGGYTTAGQHG